MTATLTDDRRRALLADRQLLGPRGRSGRGVTDVARTVGPLHSTDPSSAYLQIAARSDATVADIADALYEDRVLLRHTTLRRTVHLLTADLAVAAHGAYNHRLVPRLRARLVAWLAASPEVDGPAEPWLAEVEDRVCAAVAELDHPSGADLAEAVPELAVTFEVAPGKAYSRPQRITSKVLELLIANGRIARDRPRGGDFTSGAWTYASVTAWFPGGLDHRDPEASLAELLDHHVRAVPGSSVGDLAWWTGLPKSDVARALARIGAVEVRRSDTVTGWVAADDDLAFPDGEPQAALLPGLDVTPMGVKEREWFLGPHEPALFDRSGNIGPTVWWDGRVVGGWTQRDTGEVVTRLLEDLGADATAQVAAETQRLEEWLGPVRVRWRYPTPLQKELEG